MRWLTPESTAAAPTSCMRYRALGNTGLQVSEIGLGGEWLERHNTAEVKAVVDACDASGINLLDCWMAEPQVRSNLGLALKGRRDRWLIQGHIGSTWQDGQYVRTRDMFPLFGQGERLVVGAQDIGAHALRHPALRNAVALRQQAHARPRLRDAAVRRAGRLRRGPGRL